MHESKLLDSATSTANKFALHLHSMCAQLLWGSEFLPQLEHLLYLKPKSEALVVTLVSLTDSLAWGLFQDDAQIVPHILQAGS